MVFTNYPAWAARRFGLPREAARSYTLHGILFRLTWGAHQRWGWTFPEAWLNRLFGRWAVRALKRETWDVIHPWSGLAEEILVAYANDRARIFLMRGSAHIRTQARLLDEEAKRAGVGMDRPSAWMVAREEREYALAKDIIVLSSFAEKSFLAEGVPAQKLHRLLLAAPVERFRAERAVVEARCQRLLSGQPLQVLYVGALSYQKGLYDLAAVMERLIPDHFKFRLVGKITPEAAGIVQRFKGRAEFTGSRPESELPSWYAQGDVFIFPTIQDGYAVVLAQAAASMLPIIATENSAAPDLAVTTPVLWTLPIRSPDALGGTVALV